jgi:hypothetical protein
VTLSSDLQPTPDCISLDRLGPELTAAERIHVDTCARCQAEVALWQAFNEPSRDEAETEAVDWIVARLRRSRVASGGSTAPPLAQRFRQTPVRHLLGVAAAIMVAATLGYVVWDREPAVPPPTGEQVYRTASIDIVSPSGDVAGPPRELVWGAFPAAARYDVRVLEVDGTVVWRAISLSPRVDLPGDVIARSVPGKTLIWEVVALDESGRAVAESGPQRFRVAIAPPSGNGRE